MCSGRSNLAGVSPNKLLGEIFELNPFLTICAVILDSSKTYLILIKKIYN